jgi:MoxR-like ATPase
MFDDVLQTRARRVRNALSHASFGLIEREVLVDLVGLCAVAGEHLLVVGPPGTAKSEAVRRVAGALGHGCFEYLLSRFTEPSEIFGPIDLRRLKEGVVVTETAGMLPEAEFVFLDEVFLGSTAILNTLLGVLNERVFRRGATTRACPLRLCVGATNALPQDESLLAFSDRFLVHAFVDPLPDARLEELLDGGRQVAQRGRADPPDARATATLEDLDALAAAARAMDLGPLRDRLAHAMRKLRAAGISMSDRRLVKVQGLVAAAAALAGREAPVEADLWPLLYAVPSREGQDLARDALREILQVSRNPTLAAAAMDASLGALARADQLVERATVVLAARPEGGLAEEAWRLRLEGVAREIDATFVAAARPAAIAELRERIVAALTEDGPT